MQGHGSLTEQAKQHLESKSGPRPPTSDSGATLHHKLHARTPVAGDPAIGHFLYVSGGHRGCYSSGGYMTCRSIEPNSWQLFRTVGTFLKCRATVRFKVTRSEWVLRLT